VKIEGNRYTQDAEATSASQRTTADRRVDGGIDRSPAANRDSVEISADAQLRATALDAATNAPDIRTDLVERMRQKLDAGELGADSAALADRLIDDLLNR
jgi:flagellar biosynthesis anti-sigma factor FlgM